VSVVLFALMQAAAPAPIAANVQLACTAAMPGGQPTTFSADLQTKKLRIAALVADTGPLARVSSASAAVSWPAATPGAIAFNVATGNGQYRLELVFTGEPAAGQARLRVVTLGGANPLALVGQGFCTLRAGKRLDDKRLVATSFDSRTVPARAVKLAPATPAIPAGSCRVVSADRGLHRVDYTVLSAIKNEATVAYRFDQSTLAGTAGGNATGVLFHLATPAERLYALTVSLAGNPPVYIHQTFELTGVWIDLMRGKAVLGVGECGTAPNSLLAPLQGTRAP
jgi:hypothetical protein